MEENLLQYGLAGAIIVLLIPATKFVFDYITKTREKNDERWEKTFKRIVDDNKEREQQIAKDNKAREEQINKLSAEREERIIKALELQGKTLESINISLTSTNAEVNIIKRVLDQLKINQGGANGER